MKKDFPANYSSILTALKEKIRKSRLQAAIRLNVAMLVIYREIGLVIAEQEEAAGWGAKVVDRLSQDLRLEFSDMRGLSPRNLRYMRDFAKTYPHFPFLQVDLAKSMDLTGDGTEDTILQGELAKLTWHHHITLLDKVKDPKIRAFYIRETIQHKWTRDVMVHQIEGGLHLRKGQLSHNFSSTTDDSELVREIFKDPYKFDFIFLGEKAKERDLELALTDQIMRFLLELGQYFSFMGRQYKIQVGEKEFAFDMLFYHTRLKRYIVLELKIGDFKPEYVGKMNFYLSAADEQLRDEKDEKSIGLILCKTKDGLVAEYALRDTDKAIGIAEYKLKERLPEHIQGELPTIEEIEQSMEENFKALQSPTQARMDKLMERLTALKQETLQTPATYELLCAIFDHSLRPLYTYLLQRMEELKVYFLDSSYFFHFEQQAADLENFEKLWKDEQRLKAQMEGSMYYRLSGFKGAGVDAFDCGFQFIVRLDPYHYGFKLINYNHQQVFIKKLYNQALTQQDMQAIGDVVCQYLMDQIEGQIERIDREKKLPMA